MGRIEPLLPVVERRYCYPGRKRIPDRQAHQVLLDELHEAGEIDWSRAVADSSHVATASRSPSVTAADRNDVTQLLELVDRIAPVGPHGKFRPRVVLADRAYDSRRHRAELRDRGVTSRIAKRKTEHGSRLGTERWVIERTISWLQPPPPRTAL